MFRLVFVYFGAIASQLGYESIISQWITYLKFKYKYTIDAMRVYKNNWNLIIDDAIIPSHHNPQLSESA